MPGAGQWAQGAAVPRRWLPGAAGAWRGEEQALMHKRLLFPPQHHLSWLWETEKRSAKPQAKRQINCSVRNRPSVFRLSSID